ncbi:XRE family transcriptional regulator [Asticcacaulis biprosthecium C19]|uniref:XRE family transcriptional regulator n=1 Tax=Asticcacaulis biprosthecium C19 TaxID=715226 RepID=F4QPV2_9CAUL|nr:hypothetical protein [Asticcacaulis biprosthecium]EGF90239.1 XRE family transcriptional regulator [Asticcacaulis biprosthecium C19]
MQYEFLRTESEYQDALRRLDTLTGAPPGSPEGDELQALLDLVAAYEDDHFPED